jgi:hypothetical protein
MINEIKWMWDRWKLMSHPQEDFYRLKQFIQYYIIDKKWYKRPPVFTIEFDPKFNSIYSKQGITQIVNDTFENDIKKYPLLNTVINDIINNNYWNYDFKNKIDVESIFVHKINDFDINRGEVKYVYELSRLYFLPIIIAYAIAKNDHTLLDKTTDILYKWYKQNPFLGSIAWKSGNVVGIRTVILTYYRQLLVLSGFKTDTSFDLLFNHLISLHYKFLISHLSLYSSKGNHHIGEIAGIIAITSCFSFKNSERTFMQYTDELCQEIHRLIHNDGMNKEQSTRYQASYINLLMTSLLFANKKGYNISGEVKSRIKEAYDLLLKLQIKGDVFFQIGDDDSAQLIYPYPDTKYNIFRSMLNDASILWNKEKDPDYHFDLRNYLIFGDDGLNKYNKSENRTKYQEICLLKESGYFIIKDNLVNLLMDVGELGLRPTMCHGHSDILNISLFYKQEPILVDTGAYQYNQYYKKYRDYFHGVHAHNTISVDNREQAKLGRGMFWMNYPNITIREYSLDEKFPFCEAEHDGYCREGINVIHKRRIEYHTDKNKIVIKDTINGDDNHKIFFYLQFHPQADVYQKGNQIFVNSGKAKVTITNPLLDNGKLYKGNEEIPLGWYSSQYDKIEPSYTFRMIQDIDTHFEMETIILLN